MNIEVPGISMYFTSDKIYIRKNTIKALDNPDYIHLYINRGNKLLYIVPCKKDKDSFRIHYDEWSVFVGEDGEKYKDYKDPQAFFINARKLLDFLAIVVGVKRNSASLRFAGSLHKDKYTDKEHVIIDLTTYEVVENEKNYW